jgi:hypothetical protein
MECHYFQGLCAIFGISVHFVFDKINFHLRVCGHGHTSRAMFTRYLQLPCGHVSHRACDEGKKCPVCNSSTEENFVITKKTKKNLNGKCWEQGCVHKRRASFWPCHCNPFCQICAESYFSTQPTGAEKCSVCSEQIENIYFVHPLARANSKK